MTPQIKWLLLVLVIGGIAFYGGMKYGQSGQTNNPGLTRAGFATGQRAGRGGGMGGFVSGDIISRDNQSLTIKLRAGGSQIIFLSASTTIAKSTAGSVADLAAGETVMINGASNSDGSLTAQSIQIRPKEVIPSTP